MRPYFVEQWQYSLAVVGPRNKVWTTRICAPAPSWMISLLLQWSMLNHIWGWEMDRNPTSHFSAVRPIKIILSGCNLNYFFFLWGIGEKFTRISWRTTSKRRRRSKAQLYNIYGKWNGKNWLVNYHKVRGDFRPLGQVQPNLSYLKVTIIVYRFFRSFIFAFMSSRRSEMNRS